MRVLFVDDEPRVLSGLRRSLVMEGVDWDTCFVDSGEAALAALATEPYDVVVSDMRMPRIDGAAVLAAARERDPGMVRIMLSGQADERAALHVVRVAHQFLAKPCDVKVLRQVVERTGALQRTLEDPELRTMVGSVDRLPSALRIFHELSELLSGDDASTERVTELLCQDPAMASKLLQFANSALFTQSREISDVRQAVVRLGTKTVKNLVLGLGVFDTMIQSPLACVVSVDEMLRRAFTTAGIASGVMIEREQADSAYMAGLACDVGELVLAARRSEHLSDAWRRASDRGVPRTELEFEIFGVSHAEVGACLLGSWGLPFAVVEAVAHHHAPDRSARPGVGVASAVWIASCLASGQEPDPRLVETLAARETLRRARELASMA